MCTYFSFGLILQDIPYSITPQNTFRLQPIPVGLLVLPCTHQCRRSLPYSLSPFFFLFRTEEPAKTGTCAHDRHALQQLALNEHVKHWPDLRAYRQKIIIIIIIIIIIKTLFRHSWEKSNAKNSHLTEEFWLLSDIKTLSDVMGTAGFSKIANRPREDFVTTPFCRASIYKRETTMLNISLVFLSHKTLYLAWFYIFLTNDLVKMKKSWLLGFSDCNLFHFWHRIKMECF